MICISYSKLSSWDWTMLIMWFIHFHWCEFLHSFVLGHLQCFQCFSIATSLLWTFLGMTPGTCEPGFLWCRHVGVGGLLRYKHLQLYNIMKMFSKGMIPLYTPNWCAEEFLCSTSFLIVVKWPLVILICSSLITTKMNIFSHAYCRSGFILLHNAYLWFLSRFLLGCL